MNPENQESLNSQPERTEEQENEMLAQWEKDHPAPMLEELHLAPETVSERLERLNEALETGEAVMKILGEKGREKAKPLLNTIYEDLIALNKTKGQLTNPIQEWNSKGYLSEEKFNELNLRRKKLSNDVGIMTKTGIVRHDLNKLD